MHIKNSADRVAHLSTQLLVLARSESISQSALEFKATDLVELARNFTASWVPKALERNIELGFDAPAETVRITGDETLLQELLCNLLDNAIAYGTQGGHIGVTITPSPQPSLIVEDDGPGIQVNEIDKIFERFYRIPGSPGEGCGLGLAIVKEIAELHAARITIGAGHSGHGVRIEIVFESAAID